MKRERDDDCDASESDKEATSGAEDSDDVVCSNCSKKCFIDHVNFCSKCNKGFCTWCDDLFFSSAFGDHCYDAGEFGDDDDDDGGDGGYCVECLIKTPSAWCRNPDCACVFNVANHLRKDFKKGFLKALIPGGQRFVVQRLQKYEGARSIVVANPEDLTIADLRRVCSLLPRGSHGTSSIKKAELVQRVTNELEVEKQFYEKNK